MARRILCSPKECVLCLSTGEAEPSTIKRAWLRGYVSGSHVVALGSHANERLCKEHGFDVDEAMAFYLGNGIEAYPVSTRVNTADAPLRPFAAVGPGRTRRR
jgi:hypothetical protein